MFFVVKLKKWCSDVIAAAEHLSVGNLFGYWQEGLLLFGPLFGKHIITTNPFFARQVYSYAILCLNGRCNKILYLRFLL